MFNTILGDKFNLYLQYFNESGQKYFFLNEERNKEFINFYENRRNIGKMIFEILKTRGYNLTTKRTLELFANTYNSIGALYKTKVVDKDTTLLRKVHSSNIIDSYNRYDIDIINNNLYVYGKIIYHSPEGIEHAIPIIQIDLSNISRYVLLNPKNTIEEEIMRNLINSECSAVVGYYGNLNDKNINKHETTIMKLQKETNAELISGLHTNNSYAYILAKRKIK